MTNLLTPVWDRIAKLVAEVRGLPHFEWGVVTGASPLVVRLDGDVDPLVGSPATLVARLAVGDRVLVAIQNRRAIIVGRAFGPKGFQGDTDWTVVAPQVGTGQLSWVCRNGLVEIRWIGSGGTFPVGVTNLYTNFIPPDYRPPGNIRGTGVLNANAGASLIVGTNGTVAIINSTGASRTGGEGQCFYHL